MSKKFCFLALCVVLVVELSAQKIINGGVYNIATDKTLANVAVDWENENREYTDHSGNFHFVVETANRQEFQSHDEVIVWGTPKDLSIQISSLNGTKLFRMELKQAESFQIPYLPAGIHILTAIENHAAYTFKVVSREQHSFVADINAHYFENQLSEEILSDTLSLSKPGFLSRSLLVRDIVSTSSIGLVPENIGELDYVEELTDSFLFNLFSTEPSRANRGNVQELKFVYEMESERLYYMNSKKWSLHVDFARNVLGYSAGPHSFNSTQYFNNKDRKYILGSISYYSGIDQYVMHYVSATELTCSQLSEVVQKSEQNFIPDKGIKLFQNQDEWKFCIDLQSISSEELYEGQVYQGLTTGSTYGYLKRHHSEDIEGLFLNRRDLIVTDGIPNDLPVVAGIITSIPQTPLSHINVLSNSRNTPNMYLKDAFHLDSISSLENKLVFLEVNDHDFSIREANISEAEAFWEQIDPKSEIELEIDSATSGLLEISNLDISDINVVGGKAANFAEISAISGIDIPTPEDAFSIPFYYYVQHIKVHQLDTLMAESLNNPQFHIDAQFRKEQLEHIQASILAAPITSNLVDLVTARIKDFEDFDAYRFRSSTNAEDLEFFSGAGLYNSHSAKKNHSTKTIENAIKGVWASLWNWRAFEEREYFKIDHLSCAMGILVHRSFPNEDANGVLITKNLYNQNPGFIINVQHGEESIVSPRKGVIHDQILLFTWSVRPNEKYMIEYLSFSNLVGFEGQNVLTDEEIRQLGDLATEIKRHYFYNTLHSCDCVYDDFGVDIEFKIDSEVSPRKIYVKQARLYK